MTKDLPLSLKVKCFPLSSYVLVAARQMHRHQPGGVGPGLAALGKALDALSSTANAVHFLTGG